MIFQFHSSIETVTGQIAQDTADLMVYICQKGHNLLCSNHMWEWLEKNFLQNHNYLSAWNANLILNNRHLRDITQEKRTYLSTVTVGNEESFITPKEALKMINKPSVIIVENEANDWAVIRKWIDLLKNERAFKTINQIVCKRKDQEELCPYNAGSSGQIVNTIQQRIVEYGALTPYKVSVLCDSDKENPGADFKPEKKAIIQAMEYAGIDGHILSKREMENYFPLSTYQKANFILSQAIIPKYTDEDWDFLDIEHADFTNYKKRTLPILADYLDKPSLLSRVKNTSVKYNEEYMNEIQMIILKFAKLS